MTNPIVTIEMENGDIMKAELYPEIAPNTVNNFVSLVKKGYYDGLIFHRVINGFMIQGGCPDGTGMGGPGYTIKGEFAQNGFANNLAHTEGVLSMARAMHPDSAGSQFFIMHKAAPHLDGAYAAFGKIIEGMDIVNKIAETDTDYSDRPLDEQKMKKVTVLLILSLAICLAACGKKVSTPDEMLDVVKEKENISAEVDMIECGRIVDNDTTIVVGMTGENDKTYHYYAAQFSKNQDGKYKYKNAISLNDIGWQLRLGKLNTGYIIVCNNENVSTIQAVISPRNGSDITKNIEINNIPFVYYLDMSSIPSDYDIQYKFLNENGEEIQ